MSQGIPKFPRDYQPLVDAALAQGWTLGARKAHACLIPPPGITSRDGSPARSVTIPGSPGDRRSLLNTKRDLRRSGLDI